VPVKTAMSLVGTGSPTSKTLKKRCSSASRRISRSGLIRELNEMRANCRRGGKDRQRDWGGAKRGGEGGVGVLGTSERKVRISHRRRLLRRHAGYSWSTAGLRNGRSSPRATISGIANEYRPNMLMWSWISGESLATSAS
jgi:hypothetical protein